MSSTGHRDQLALVLQKQRIRHRPRLLLPLSRHLIPIHLFLRRLSHALWQIRHAQAPQPVQHAARLVDLRANRHGLGARAVQVLLHQRNGRLARLVRAVLVEDVVEVDEEGAQVLDLGLGVRGVARERAVELEEVEEEGFGEALELEGAVEVLCVLVAGLGGRGEVGDALFFERGEFIVEHVLIAKHPPPPVDGLCRRLKIDEFLGHTRYTCRQRIAAMLLNMRRPQLINTSDPVGRKVLPERWRVGKRRREGVSLWLLVGHFSGDEEEGGVHLMEQRDLSRCDGELQEGEIHWLVVGRWDSE